jgi:hypothetical protein
MAAVENERQPPGPPNVSMAIRLASEDLLHQRVPPGDVADTAWQLSAYCQDGSSHDLALVMALYFLRSPEAVPKRLDALRMDARLLAQRWMTDGLASVGVVSRFEEALFRDAR